MKSYLYRCCIQFALAIAGLFAAPLALAKWSVPYLVERLTRDGGAQGASATKAEIQRTYQRQLSPGMVGNFGGMRKESHGFRQGSFDEYDDLIHRKV